MVPVAKIPQKRVPVLIPKAKIWENTSAVPIPKHQKVGMELVSTIPDSVLV